MEEVVLAGGVANAGMVVRVGGHVLRPSNPHSAVVHQFLAQLRGYGFDGASEPVGIDGDGRERLVFIEGDVPLPPYPDWARSDAALVSVGELLRRFHLASARCDGGDGTWSDEMADPLGGPVVCHNDVCLENVVFRDGVAVGLLDFDFAAPGRASYDVAQFARMCVPIDDDVTAWRSGWQPSELGGRPRRLRLACDAYGLDRAGREELLDAVSETIARVGEFLRRRIAAGDPNFTKMWDEIGGDERFARRLRWWQSHRADFESALA
jgi:hypothetical protein